MVTQQEVNRRGMSCRGRITICIENVENVVSAMLVFSLLYKVYHLWYGVLLVCQECYSSFVISVRPKVFHEYCKQKVLLE